MIIDSKEAGTGFKFYCLCWSNYLLSLKYIFKIAKITGLIKSSGLDLSDTQAVVIQLLKELSESRHYWVYTDNFFTSTKLAFNLRQLNMALIGTCKAKSGVLDSLLKLKEVATKEKNWGIKEVTTADFLKTKNKNKRKRIVEKNEKKKEEEKKKLDIVLCVAWQDNNTTLIMSTAYISKEAIREDKKNYRHFKRRKNIPSDSIIDEIFLAWFQCIVDYNNNMEEVDANAQMQAYYSAKVYAQKYWWNLFKGLLLKACINSYILFKLVNKNDDKASKMTHFHWIQEISSQLMRTPAGGLDAPPHASNFNDNSRPSNPSFEHRKIRLDKLQYCTSCTENGRKTIRVNRRRILNDISSNERRQRPSRIMTGCAVKACEGKTVCKAIQCWRQLHGD